MPLLNKLFGKKEKTVAIPAPAKAKVDSAIKLKGGVNVRSKILFSHATEKALSGQKFNKYVFKVWANANKIMIASEVKKTYNVKVTGVNIINIPRKARRVGKTVGFKKGYKKAVVTLASGQSIEIAK